MPSRRLRFTADDRAASAYPQVPFDVPAGAPAVAVRIGYDRTTAVIDLGALDPDGFRGWSGGARDGYVITPSAATPGYLPGPLPAGTWHVLLGLHRLPPGGADVTVDTAVTAAHPAPLPPPPPRPLRPPRRDLPAAPGRRWLACDFHAHTVHSDGQLTIHALACLAAGRGLDVLAVTDHNTTSHHPHLAEAGAYAGITLLPGQEVTTDTGHANCFGDVGWIDFRQPADAWRAAADARGGLLSLNHPLLGDYAWRRPLRLAPRLVEAWHASWDRTDPTPLRWWAARGGVPIGGSDFHRPGVDALPGAPTTWVEVDIGHGVGGVGGDGGVPGGAGLPSGGGVPGDGADVLAALAAGRVALAADPLGPALLRCEDDLVAADADGSDVVGPDGDRRTVHGDLVRWPAAPGLHRLVDAHDRTLALVA